MEQISPSCSGPLEYYHPDQWMPHITIGFGDISKNNLSEIIPFLSERNFNWEITVNNIALIYDTGTKQELKSRFDITNEPVLGESSMERLQWHHITSEILEEFDRLRERVIHESKGYIFEDSTEKIRQQHEERTQQLMGEDEE